MGTKRDLLLEIGCEELPASFVAGALAALPELAKKRLDGARLAFEKIEAKGTPRRLALLVHGLTEHQPDLAEDVLGPPVRAAFKDGAPTRAAEAFAEKLGVAVADLRRVDTPKGEYLSGSREETGQPAATLLPELLKALISEIPFKKSMRWGDLDFAFGRPIQWIVALFGADVVPLELAAVTSGRTSLGHRFLSVGPITIAEPSGYVAAMRAAHVLVDPEERRAALVQAIDAAAKEAGGSLIPDEFLVEENLSLVEEPHVVVGSFEEAFLDLPERVILEVAKGHQRYFGVRGADGKLLPKYLAVVNTANDPASIKKGNDSVMRARLSDARFFYTTDRVVPLASRKEKLGGVVFQKRLGTVLEKVERIETLVDRLGALAGLSATVIADAKAGAALAKCDLVSLMVGEFPELQGDMGASYAVAQGTSQAVADVIRDHYRPKGASDATATSEAAALVAIADRLDSLVGILAIGLTPSGSADPFGLRRAVLGVLRTLLDRRFDLSITGAARAAFGAYAGKPLDLTEDALAQKVVEFATERLRGLLSDRLPADAVRAAIATGADRPLDVERRALAVAELDAATRAQVGEVFKRATNIASQAKPGEPAPPTGDIHPSEAALFEAYGRFRARADELSASNDYAGLLREVASLAPVMHKYFADVLVMAEDLEVRDNRLRLMRSISDRCMKVARLELLASQ